MQSMGEIIALRRKELGMTQKELAEQMHVTDKAVSKWERGLACPDVSTIPHLAQVLGITVNELMSAEVLPKKQESEAEKIFDLILRALPLAMGAAVVVLSALGELDLKSGFGLLGVGMFCLALQGFRR